MKRELKKSPVLLSLISVIVTIIFFLLATGSVDILQNSYETTYDETTGLYTKKVYIKNPYDPQDDEYRLVETMEGKRNEYGKWIGEVKVTHHGLNNYIEYREFVSFDGGKRTGFSERSIRYEGNLRVIGNDMYIGGKYIGPYNESTQIKGNGQSAWQILEGEYPWFVHGMNGSGFSDEHLEALTDTIETLLALEDFSSYKFDDYYDDVIWDIDFATPFEEVLDFNSKVSEGIMLDELKDSPFRMAVVDYYRSSGRSLLDIVRDDYASYYLSEFAKNEERKENFARFCFDMQDSLNTYPHVEASDPFLTDSVDNYLGQIFLNALDDDDDAEFSEKPMAKLLSPTIIAEIKELRNSSVSLEILKNHTFRKFIRLMRSDEISDATTQMAVNEYDFSSMAFTVFRHVYGYGNEEADIIKEAVRKAWLLKNGVVSAPVLGAMMGESKSDNSAEVIGHITWDGGAPITERGVVWAESYEPTINDNKIEKGTGTGEFKVRINGLTKGKKYHARGYAVNSQGISYGNNVEFIAEETTGTNEAISNLSKLQVYPNPARDIATVSFNLDLPSEVKLQLIDLSGREVLNKENGFLSQGIHQLNLNVETLDGGVYFLRIMAGKDIMEKKLIILNDR